MEDFFYSDNIADNSRINSLITYSSHKLLTEERECKVSRDGAGAVIRGQSLMAVNAKFSVRPASEGHGESLEFYVEACPEHLAAVTLSYGGPDRNGQILEQETSQNDGNKARERWWWQPKKRSERITSKYENQGVILSSNPTVNFSF